MKSKAALTTAGSASPFRYRPEIDGLRAVAVIAVILNHFNHDLLQSGYLGVDVFFVISGFVITSSLTKQAHSSAKEFFLAFYARRIRRLLPALLVVVLVTSLLTVLFDPSPGGSLRTGLASLIGASNIQLLKQSTDYFAVSTDLNTFTHTWSLGVEEQFYLVFPLLLWLSGVASHRQGSSRRLCLLITALALASLIAYAVLSRTNQAFAYFSMPTRFWELAYGSLIFVALRHRRLRGFLQRVPALLLLALLILALFTGFKVKSTIAVVTLTGLLIASLREGTPAFRVLTTPPALTLGLLSYSLYLWHWPVLSLSRWTIGIHPWSAPLQVLLMLALASLSYWWIESPLRHAPWLARAGRAFGFGIASAAATSLVPLALLAPWAPRLFLGDLAREGEQGGASAERPAATGKPAVSCMWWRGEGPNLDDAAKHCIPEGATGGSRHRFFLLGDSHTGDLAHWLATSAKRHGYWVRHAYAGGQSVPVVENAWEGSERVRRQDALRQKQWIQRTLADARPGDTLVVITYLLQQFRTPEQRASLAFDGVHSRWDRWMEDLEALIESAAARGAHVVIFAPTPDFQLTGGWASVTDQACTYQWFRTSLSEACFYRKEREKAVAEVAPILQRLRDLERGHANFHVFDPFAALCPPDRKSCTNYRNGRRTYVDYSHLSRAGSALLTPAFDASLKAWGIL